MACGNDAQEAKSRILALKEKGKAFRFYDFLEDKDSSTRLHPIKFHLFGLGSQCLVPLAVFLFSVVFVLAHWLILCRPGPKLE